MSAKKPTIEEQIAELLSAGETTDRIAEKLDLALPKVRLIASSLPVEDYRLFGASGSLSPVLFGANNMNEYLDWNRPIVHYNNQIIAQQFDGQWYGCDLRQILDRAGLNFGSLDRIVVSDYLPEFLRSSPAGKKVINDLCSISREDWIEQTWIAAAEKWKWLREQGDLEDQLESIHDNRQMKEFFAELMSEDMRNTPLSKFVDECLSLWLNKSTLRDSFRNATHNTNLWIETWFAASSNPYEAPEPIIFEDGEDDDLITAILEACSPFDDKVIKYMVESKEFNSADVNLALNGKIKPEDIVFAKSGGFTTAKQVKAAKKLDCTTLVELKAVQSYGWEDGGDLRHAQNELGLEAHEYELFLKIKASIASSEIDWYGGLKTSMIDWARNQDLDLLDRLTGFESPKSLVFFESVLLETSERAIRTDYLLRHYNETDAPGPYYNEDDFEEYLREQPFMNVVKAGHGGVSMISPKKQDAARKKHFGQ